RFQAEEDQPSQVISPATRVPMPILDLERLDRERRLAELDRLGAEAVGRPFVLSVGPLLRTTLVRLAEEEWVLLVILHHIVADGWSLAVFLEDLAASYTATARPDLPFQYADFAVWQREWLQGDVLEALLGY